MITKLKSWHLAQKTGIFSKNICITKNIFSFPSKKLSIKNILQVHFLLF